MAVLFVRTINESDISLIANYWRQCSEDFLRMGIERDKFDLTSAFEDKLQDSLGLINKEKAQQFLLHHKLYNIN